MIKKLLCGHDLAVRIRSKMSPTLVLIHTECLVMLHYPSLMVQWSWCGCIEIVSICVVIKLEQICWLLVRGCLSQDRLDILSLVSVRTRREVAYCVRDMCPKRCLIDPLIHHLLRSNHVLLVPRVEARKTKMLALRCGRPLLLYHLCLLVVRNV